MKISPVARFDQKIGADSQRAKDYLKTMRVGFQDDEQGRSEWLEKKRYWFRRRYMEENRRPNFPWPGASEICMPLIDMNIDRMKPMFVNLVANAHPPVTVLAATSEHQKKSATIELFFDWLIRSHSPHFIREIIYGVDDMLECGRMILKTFWRYETRTEYETLSYRSMPETLRRFIVVKSNKQVAQFQGLTGETLMTKVAFKEFSKQIRMVIAQEMDLDEDEPQDKKAIDEIISWLESGAEKPITFKKRNTLIDCPAICAVNPAQLIVPGSTTSIEDAERITHEMTMTAPQLRARVKDLGWNESVVEDIIKTGAKASRPRRRIWQDEESEESLREGIKYQDNLLFTIYETIGWMDYNQDRRDENVVTVWSPDTEKDNLPPLAFYAYSRPSGRRPYHTTVFEPNKRRWYSPRGVPEKLSDLDWEITYQHRAKLNRMMIANAPTFMYRMHRNVNPQNFRWIPGQMVPVMDPTDVAPMQVPNLDMSFEREEQILKTWGEQYLGATDFSLSNPLSSLNEPRTKYEIEQVQASARQSLSLRGLVFQKMLEEVYDEFFDLWLTYGPDEIFARVTGEEPVRLSKEDLEGDYLFVCTGSIGQEDPALEASKALARVQILNQMAQAPGLLGNEFELNLGEAVMDWLEKDDIRAARRIVRRRTPEEIQKLEQEQAQQQQMAGMMQGMQAGQLFGQATEPGGGGGGGGTKPRKVG